MKTFYLKTTGLICLVWLTCTPTFLSAQRVRTIDNLFSTYEQTKGVTYVNLSPKLLLMMKDSNSTELDEVFASIGSLRIISLSVASNEQKSLADKIRTDALHVVKEQAFEEIMKVRNEGSELLVYLSKKSTNAQQPQALLMISNGVSEFVLIGITGKISGEVISAIMDGKIGIL